MKKDAWKMLVSFACMLLGFAPLIYWGSQSRYQAQVDEEVHRRIQADLGHAPEVKAVSQPGEGLLFPVKGKTPKDVISGFGDPRGRRIHQGIDVKADRGTPVLAIGDGVVERVKNGGNGGRQIWLTLDNDMTVFYAHLHEQWVEEGDKVNSGSAIGSVGNTGNASHTSPHLHFEIILPEKGEVDPLEFYGKP
jgi:murein DD-endopeptidase MepM/ murein hydrolase activator NlpD